MVIHILTRRCLAALELSVSRLWRSGPNWLGMTLSPVSVLPPEMLLKLEIKAADQRQSAASWLVWVMLLIVSIIVLCTSYTELQLMSSNSLTFWGKGLAHLISQHRTYLLPRDAGYGIIRDSWKKSSDSLHGQFCSEMRMNCGDVGVGCKMLTYPSLLSTPCSWIDHTTWLFQAHSQVQHNGVKETLAEVRMNFWIIGGRKV